jgi:hypothetical protein
MRPNFDYQNLIVFPVSQRPFQRERRAGKRLAELLKRLLP